MLTDTFIESNYEENKLDNSTNYSWDNKLVLKRGDTMYLICKYIHCT